MKALEKLNDVVDESDPDVDFPNIVHAFQTAEQIRKEYPNEDWFHLTGLIHDLGKVRGKVTEIKQICILFLLIICTANLLVFFFMPKAPVMN